MSYLCTEDAITVGRLIQSNLELLEKYKSALQLIKEKNKKILSLQDQLIKSMQENVNLLNTIADLGLIEPD